MQDTHGNTFHFAYGSNKHPEHFRQFLLSRSTDAQKQLVSLIKGCRATTRDNYRVVNRDTLNPSVTSGGKANLEPGSSSTVAGCLYCIPDELMPLVDIKEGLMQTPPIYTRQTVQVLVVPHHTQLVDAVVYAMNPVVAANDQRMEIAASESYDLWCSFDKWPLTFRTLDMMVEDLKSGNI